MSSPPKSQARFNLDGNWVGLCDGELGTLLARYRRMRDQALTPGERQYAVAACRSIERHRTPAAMTGPLGDLLSRAALLAAVDVEINAPVNRCVVLVDAAGRETTVPLRQFRLRLLNGLHLAGLDLFFTPCNGRVAS